MAITYYAIQNGTVLFQGTDYEAVKANFDAMRQAHCDKTGEWMGGTIQSHR